MTPRDALANFFPAYYDRTYLFDADFEDADAIIAHLTAAGFVILPAAEAQAIRDKALEEAATLADLEADRHNAYGLQGPKFQMATRISTAIRALKGARP